MATLAELLGYANALGSSVPSPDAVANILPQDEPYGLPGPSGSPLEGLLRTGLSGQPLSLPDLTGMSGGLTRLLMPGATGPTGAMGGLGGIPGLGGAPTIPTGPTGPSGPTPGYTGGYNFTPIRTGKVPIEDRRPPALPSASEVAPEIQRVYNEVWARWPSSTNLGTHVVKYISGTDTLSQHSFGDAIDIGGNDDDLTQIASWLPHHADELGVTEVIFKDRIWTTSEGWHPYTRGGHDTHVHVTGPQVYTDTTPDFRTINWHAPRPHPQRSPVPHQAMPTTGTASSRPTPTRPRRRRRPTTDVGYRSRL